MIKNIEIMENEICIYGDYSDKDACKGIPTRLWNPEKKCWRYEKALSVLQGIKTAFPLAYEKFGLEKVLKEVKASRKSIETSLPIPPATPKPPKFAAPPRYLQNTTPNTPPNTSPAISNKKIEQRLSELGGTLMPFQVETIRYALDKKRLFVADEMGLGKTVQALATLHVSDAYPALIICPAIVKHNWRLEAEKWLPSEIKVVAVKDAKSVEEAVGADVVIITYDLFTRVSPFLASIPFEFMILDESHYVKNGQAKRTKLIKKFAADIEYILLLSGTPLLSRPAELIEQLKVIAMLTKFGGWDYFTGRYCNKTRKPWGWDISGSTNLKELNTRLREMCYIRHDKKAVLKDLPDKMRSQVFFDLTKSQMKDYNKAKQELERFLRENLDKTEREIKRSMKAEVLVRIEVLKALVAKQKLEDAKEWIRGFLESGEKLVVFATHRDVIDDLCDAFPDALSITGDTSTKVRQEVVEHFQNDESIKLVILGLKAASTGITLTAASNVAFLELGWTPADMQQAEDRVYRIGQKNAVNVWYLLANETIDVEIATLIDMKKDSTKAAIEGVDVKSDDKILDRMIEFFSPALGSVRKKGEKK